MCANARVFYSIVFYSPPVHHNGKHNLNGGVDTLCRHRTANALCTGTSLCTTPSEDECEEKHLVVAKLPRSYCDGLEVIY